MHDRLNIDFETRSPVNLKKSGVYPYALDPDTDIWCMAYAFGDEEPELWFPGDVPPPTVVEHVEAGGEVRAWNANFERIIWNMILRPRYGFPKLLIEQTYDTMIEAMAMNLPRGLGQCARVLNLEQEKDDEGRTLMLKMSKPVGGWKAKPPYRWYDDPEDIARLGRYCQQDVRTERAIGELLVRLTPMERENYELDQRVNDRGILIDTALVDGALKLIEVETERVNARVSELTEGDAESVTQVAALTRWLQERGVLPPDTVDEDGNPEENPDANLQKLTVQGLLSDPSTHEIEREVLRLRADAGRTSLGKFKKVADVLCPDDRVRGQLLHHAASTGRWAGRLLQPQNFPRPFVPDYASYVPLIRAADAEAIRELHPSVMDVLVSNLRSMFIARPGRRFLSADYSQIEARITCWLGGEEFREKEYEKMAAAIYGVPWEEIGKDSEERGIGKNVVLGCGFGMGAEKFADYTYKATGIRIEDELAQKAVNTYREQKPGVKDYWYKIEAAAKRAVAHPGEVVPCPAGKVRYVVRGQFLWCILPSGRPIAYCLPQIRNVSVPWSETEKRAAVTFMGINTYTRRWQRNTLYGGLQTENVVQAIARDVMVHGMRGVENAGYPVVLTVHDEVLAEAPEDYGSLEEFEQIMSDAPTWIKGCPIEVEGWEGDRWRK